MAAASPRPGHWRPSARRSEREEERRTGESEAATGPMTTAAGLDLPLGRDDVTALEGVPEGVPAPARAARISCWMISRTEPSSGSGTEAAEGALGAPGSGADTGVASEAPSESAIATNNFGWNNFGCRITSAVGSDTQIAGHETTS